MPGPNDKKVKYDIEVGADTKGADQASESFEKVEESAKEASSLIEKIKALLAKSFSFNLDGSKAQAEARGVHNAVQEVNQAADDHASINIDGSKAEAEAKQAKKAVDQAKKTAEKPAQKGGFFERLKDQIADLRADIPLVEQAFKGLEFVAKGSLAIVLGLVGALVLSFGKLTASVREYVNESRNISKIDAALAQTGQLTRENRKEVLALATDFEDLTGVVRQDWVSVLTKLINFGARENTLGIDAKAVENLAGLLGGREGLSQAVDIYSRALQGEFGSFQELGFQLDLSASKHENLAKVQRIAAERGAGQLRAEAKSAGGEVDQLGIVAQRTSEGIGRLFANTGILSGGISILKDGLGVINEFLPQTTERLDGLTNKLPRLSDELKEAGRASEEDVAAGLKAITDSASEADATLALLLQRLRQLEQAELAKVDATAAFDLSQVDLAEANQEITRNEANEQRFGIRNEAAKRKLEIETQALELQIKELQAAQEKNDQQVLDTLNESQRVSQEIADKIQALAPTAQQGDELKDLIKALEDERVALEERLKPLEKFALFEKVLGTGRIPTFLLSGKQRETTEGARADLADSRKRLEEVVEKRLNLESTEKEIFDSSRAAKAEIDALKNEQDLSRQTLASQVENRDSANEKLAAQLEALAIALDTRTATGSLNIQTNEASREAARVVEEREAAKAAEDRRKRETEERLKSESIALGSNVERFAGERLPGGAIADQVRESARALSDGGDARELQELESAILEAFRAFLGRDQQRASEIQRVGQEVRKLAGQIENSRQ